MQKPTILAVSAVLAMTVFAPTSNAGRMEKPNMVGGELLGRGLALTVNYERYVTNVLGFGAGLMAISTGDGTVTVIPLYVSVVPGDVHSVYLSGGATMLGGGGSLQDYESTWIMTGAVGYQYQSPGGFFVRPMFTLLIPTESTDDFLVWPGITIGGSF